MTRMSILMLLLMSFPACEMDRWDGIFAGYILSVSKHYTVVMEAVVVFHSQYVRCDSSNIGSVVLREMTVKCGNGACPTSLNFTCIDYSDHHNISITYAKDEPPSEDGFYITLESDFVDETTKRYQTTSTIMRGINAALKRDSPFSTFGSALVHTIDAGCTRTIDITVDDLLDKNVTCTQEKSVCGAYCQLPKGVSIIKPCSLYITDEFLENPVDTNYVVQLLMDRQGTESYTNFHIILHSRKKTRGCDQRPTFIDPTPLDGSCYQLFEGDNLKLKIVANPIEGDSITEIRTTLLPGMTKTPLTRNGSTSDYFIEVEYNNSAAVANYIVPGAKMFCFTARDNTGGESESRCVKIIPTIESTKTYLAFWPLHPITATFGTDVHIRFSTINKVSRPLRGAEAEIRLHPKGSVVQTIDISQTTMHGTFSDKTLSFNISAEKLLPETKYYVTLKRGAALVREQYCKLRSVEYVYLGARFTVEDHRPPSLTFLSTFTLSSSSVTIKWKTNKAIHYTLCYFMTAKVVCNREWTKSGLADGNHTLLVTILDKYFVKASAVYRWDVETVPPNITCHKLPTPFNRNTTVEIMCTCNENCTALCRIANKAQAVGEYGSCSNLTQPLISFSESDLQDGEHVLDIQATDEVGNKNSFHYEWTLDTEPPNTRCHKYPAPVSRNAADDIVCTCDESCSAMCRIVKKSQPDGPYQQCSNLTQKYISIFKTNLSDNENYQFDVKATDRTGNTKSYQYNWKTDFLPPICTIVKKPQKKSNKTVTEISFTCNEPCTTKCSLVKQGEQPSFTECGGNYTVTEKSYTTPNLTTATEYVFTFAGTDIAGNKGALISYEWKTDFIKPILTITKKPISPNNERNAIIIFSCNEPCVTKCCLQNGSTSTGFVDCGGQLSMDNKTFTTPDLMSAVNYTVKILPTDSTGNEGDIQEWTWLTDMDAPVCTIDKKPPLRNNEINTTLSFSCNEPSKTKCSLNIQQNSSFEDCGGNASIALKTYTTPTLTTNTTYVFMVYGIDIAGNQGILKSYQWTTDLIPPNCTIVKHPKKKSNETVTEISFSCNEPSTTNCSFVKQGEEPSFTECGGNYTVTVKSYTTPTLTTSTAYVFTFAGTDIAGNKGGLMSYEWKTDFIKPILTITKKPISPNNERNAVIKFSCNEDCVAKCCLQNGSTSTGFVDCGGQLSNDTKTFATPDLMSAVNYTLKILSIDCAGNEGDIQEWTWLTDFDKPICTFDKALEKNSSKPVVELKMSCNEATVMRCAITRGADEPVVVPCGEDLSAAQRTFKSKHLQSENSYIFTFYCIDAAGNIGRNISHLWYTAIKTSLTAVLRMSFSGNVNDYYVFDIWVKRLTPLLRASVISSMQRKGSLIVNYNVDKKDWNHVYSIVDKGNVIMDDGAIIPVEAVRLHQKVGTVVNITTSLNPCVVYEEYYNCPVTFPCKDTAFNDVECSAVINWTSTDLISMGVGIVVFFALVGTVSLLIHYRKPPMKNKEQRQKDLVHGFSDKNDMFRTLSWNQPRFHRTRFLGSKMFRPDSTE